MNRKRKGSILASFIFYSDCKIDNWSFRFETSYFVCTLKKCILFSIFHLPSFSFQNYWKLKKCINNPIQENTNGKFSRLDLMIDASLLSQLRLFTKIIICANSALQWSIAGRDFQSTFMSRNLQNKKWYFKSQCKH